MPCGLLTRSNGTAVAYDLLKKAAFLLRSIERHRG